MELPVALLILLRAVLPAVCVSTGRYALLRGGREAEQLCDFGVYPRVLKLSPQPLRGEGLRRTLCVIAELLAHTALTRCVGLFSIALLLPDSSCLC